MDKNICKIEFSLLCLALITNPLLAETPYKLEIQKIPISSNAISIYKDLIAYKSGYGEISLYNITSNKTKILLSYSSPLEVRDIILDGNLIFYRLVYHTADGIKLKMYDLSKNKTYDIAKLYLYTNFFVRDNTLLYSNEFEQPVIPPGYNISTYRISLEVEKNKRIRNIYSNNLIISNIIKVINDSVYRTKLFNIITKNTTFFPRWYNQIRNNRLLGKTYVYNLESQEEISLSEEFSKEGCGEKTILSETGVWALSSYNSKHTKICYYDFQLNSTFSGIGPSYPLDGYDCYGDILVFSNGYIAYVKYGNLTQICKSYSKIENFGNISIENNCSLVNQSICFCQIFGSDFVYNHTARHNFSFELVNSQDSDIEMIINKKFDEIKNQIKEKITKTETVKIQKIKEEQSKKSFSIFVSIITILFFLISILSASSYFINRKKEIEKLKDKAKERLDYATKLISKGKDISKLLKKADKEYVKMYIYAVELFNKGKYKESEEVASDAINAKKREEKIKEEIEEIEKKIDLTKTIKSDKDSYEEIEKIYKETKEKIEQEKYNRYEDRMDKKRYKEIMDAIKFEKEQKRKKLESELKAKEEHAKQVLQKIAEISKKSKLKEIQNIYKQACECVEKGYYTELDGLFNDALRKYNIKLRKKKELKKQLEKMEYIRDSEKTVKPIQDKYLEIKKKFKQEKYNEVEKLIAELWSIYNNYNAGKETLSKIEKYYQETKNYKIKNILIKAKKEFEKGNFRQDELEIKAFRIRQNQIKKKKIKRLIEDLESKIDLEKTIEIIRWKYNESKRKFKQSKYNEAEELIKEIWDIYNNYVNYKSLISKIKDYYQETKKKEIKNILTEAKKELENANFEQVKKLHEEAFAIRQKSKGLKLFEGRWLKPDKIKEIISIRIGLNNNFANLTGYQFEELIAELFARMGYKTKVTPKSGDYGVDVIAMDKEDIIAIQCKKLKDGINVSNRDIQRARGSMDFYNANKCIVVTNQDFTIQAKEQARRTKNTEIWNKRILHEMIRRYFIDKD